MPKVLFDLYLCGSGGRPHQDGPDGGGLNRSVGGMIATPAEVIERRHAARVEGFEFVADSGGAGKHRGSVSVRRSWRFLRDGKATVRMYHFKNVANGLSGGKGGTKPRVTLESNGAVRELTGENHLSTEVRAGDVLTHVFCGAGGHGDPRERDMKAVLEDVLDEKMSVEGARREYGVVIDPATMQIDERATAEARSDARWKFVDNGEASVRGIRRLT
jgi:N-methylhydantoinase B